MVCAGAKSILDLPRTRMSFPASPCLNAGFAAFLLEDAGIPGDVSLTCLEHAVLSAMAN